MLDLVLGPCDRDGSYRMTTNTTASATMTEEAKNDKGEGGTTRTAMITTLTSLEPVCFVLLRYCLCEHDNNGRRWGGRSVAVSRLPSPPPPTTSASNSTSSRAVPNLERGEEEGGSDRKDDSGDDLRDRLLLRMTGEKCRSHSYEPMLHPNLKPASRMLFGSSEAAGGSSGGGGGRILPTPALALGGGALGGDNDDGGGGIYCTGRGIPRTPPP